MNIYMDLLNVTDKNVVTNLILHGILDNCTKEMLVRFMKTDGGLIE